MAKDEFASVYFDRNERNFNGLTPLLVDKLKENYKKVDVDVEIKKMQIWLLSPKGKSRKGNINFILNWLNNACPVSIPMQDQKELIDDSPLRPLIQNYLRELWTGREHILEMNKRKKI